jgi:hypothetical protein
MRKAGQIHRFGALREIASIDPLCGWPCMPDLTIRAVGISIANQIKRPLANPLS